MPTKVVTTKSGSKTLGAATTKTSGLSAAKKTTLTNQLNAAKKQLAGLQAQAKSLSNPSGNTGNGSAIAANPNDALIAQQNQQAALQAQYLKDQQKEARQSAYDLLQQQFTQYGLGSLVEPLKGLIKQNVSPSEFALRLQETDAYKKRFSANADRISKGLGALSPAEYIAMEDQYQNIMRNYGLPSSYYAKDSLGTQAGFNQLLGNDVSAAELEDRVMTAQNRVVNANPEVTKALKAFYPDITNGDILAYTLDPTKALDMIKRKVTAAEIGGAALSQGLTTEATSAENLAKYGINAAQAQQGYGQIAGMLPRASQLSDIYGQGAYNQATAEAATFGTAGAAEAIKKTKKLSELEQASFSGSSGTSGNALSRDRAMSQMQYSSPGAGGF